MNGKFVRLPVIFLAMAVVGALLANLLGSPLVLTLLTQAVMSAILATGVGFLVRQNGLVSFGHAAFFGIGAYVVALCATYHVMPIGAALLLAILAPAVLALLLGAAMLRLAGVAFSMLTLAVAQAFYELVLRWRGLANGDDGIAAQLPPHILGLDLSLFQQPGSMFAICWIALMLVLLGLSLLITSHFGTLTMAIRENEERARFIGYQTIVPRAVIYAISAAIAALAGVLFALYNGFVTPDVLYLESVGRGAGDGGDRRHARGVGPGARRADLLPVQERRRRPDRALAGDHRRHADRRHGAAAARRQRHHFDAARAAGRARVMSAPAAGEWALEGDSLTRRFGGFLALDNVSIALRPGEIRGLIGPNGAGKSTLMDVLSGRGGPADGQVKLFGRDISVLPARQRRRAGLARSFQRTNIFPDLTVAEQIGLATHAAETDNSREVMEVLELAALADRRAADISYGDQRRLDVALALVGRPRVLLLDEPAAGLSMAESLNLALLLRDLAARWQVTVLIVEHDMEVIFSICSHLTVLHLGRILADGSPEQVRAMPEVITAYLGSAHPGGGAA